MVLVYITCKDSKEAERIAMRLLRKRIVACTNIFPVRSLYWWKGKIINEKEHVIIAKTIKKRYQELEKEVKKLHSYEVPCVLRVSADANKEYQGWLTKEIK